MVGVRICSPKNKSALILNMKLFAFFAVGIFLLSQNAFSQLTGIKTIPGDYTTITSAVNAINTSGVGVGGVTFNIDRGYTETITATISLTATGTVANPIIFQRDPGTSGANPLITSYTGGTGTPATATQDGLWRLVGSDYITIDGIDLKENPLNTTNPSTMEYGFALYKQSLSNGCQNVTITNCEISLNKINNEAGIAPMVDGSVGIAVMNATPTAAITILVPTTSAGTNSYNTFYSNKIQNCNNGIALIGYAAASPFTASDRNNDVGGTALSTGNTIVNFGGASGAVNAACGIRTLAQYELSISFNTLNNNNGTGTNHENVLRGIYVNLATSANSTIGNNIITLKGGGTSSNITAIENAAGSTAVGNEIDISNNTIINSSYSTATTATNYGIYNTGAPATLSINGNNFLSNSTSASATGVYYSIFNNGAATTLININDNNINGLSFTNATSQSYIGIYNLAGGTSAALSISNNNFKGINYLELSSGTNTYILNAAATLSQVISANTFTNLNINSTGTITFISNSVAVSANGNQVVDDNAIVGSFSRSNTATSGQLTLFSSSASSVSGSVISNSNNDFSNITVYGAATINGWVNTDAGASSKTIQGNIFSNWTGGTGSITGMSVNITGSNNATVANLISNISSAGSITGISTASGNDNIYSNTISNLNSTGSLATVVTGIAVGAGTTKNIYLNKINTLSCLATTGSVNGMTIAGSTTVNAYDNVIHTLTGDALTTGRVSGIWISAGTTVSAYRNKLYNYTTTSAALTTGGINGLQVSGTASNTVSLRNNIIGSLKATAANITDAIRGINLTATGVNSTINVYYNTIHLDAASSGVNFGSSGIYHTTSATSTTAQLDMRNNIIHNMSVAKGTGLTVAYRRSNSTLTNYSALSNTNLFYAGLPTSSNLIFSDGTNVDQTLSSFKSRMATRDAASVSEDLATTGKFLSTTGSSRYYLHMNDAKASAVRSGGINISGVTVDFDNDVRQGNGGYAGTGTAPDIGADEYAGISYTPLSGTYNVGTGQAFTSLTSAGGLFAKINRAGLSGNITVLITSDLTEDGLESLNEWIETGAGNYTITIQPNNTTLRTISGDVATGLIRLNGADRVTFDGGENKLLTFKNTSTLGTTGTAFTLINGASDNIIKRCNIEAFTNASNGVILFSTSATYDGGNSNNLIDNCNINASVGASNGIVAIVSAGTNVAGFVNSANTISNNNIFNYRERGLEIKSTGSVEWTIAGNSFYNGSISSSINYAAGTALHGIRILGGANYTIANNYIGGSASLSAGAEALYSSTLGNITYQGILLTSTNNTGESIIKGNVISNINYSSVPAAASSPTFYGIETNGTNIVIGGSNAGDGNIIGSTSLTNSIKISTATTTSTFTTFARGISCLSSDGKILGNQIAGFELSNTGSAPAPTTFIGIYANNPVAPSQVINNIIGGTTANSISVVSGSTAKATSITGISVGTAVGSTMLINGNTIKNVSHLSSAIVTSAGGVVGITAAARATAEINIINNVFESNSISANTTTGLFYGFQNTGASGIVRINSNIFRTNTINSTTSVVNAIRNTGLVFNTIEINSNVIGDASNPSITFTAINSGAQILINNTGAATSANLTINNNKFQNINYTVNGTGANTFISNTAVTLSQSIEGNTFTNLNVQTSGSNTFISNSVALPSGGDQSVSNNSIVGTYAKRAGGTVTFITSAATCASGSTIDISNNNFSNVTVTGATVINGLVNTDAGSSNKMIAGNYFTNWVGGTSAITGMNVNITGVNNSVSGNVIRNISGASIITGITTGAGNDNINNNVIDSLFSSGGTTTTVTGIAVTAGTVKNIYKNTLSNIVGSALTTGSVRGILVSGGTTVNAYQNTIFNISGNAISSGSVNGIVASGGSTININRNKIYDLSFSNASTTGSVYGVQVSGAVANLMCNISSNIIGDLKTPAASNTDAIRGIGIISTGLTSTINVFYNTVYLNATSSGVNFGTSGVYHTTSATATTANLNLRNNSITNIAVAKGTGKTVAYRRSTSALTNYATTSNNNMLYAGTPSAASLIYFDVTNSDQTIAAFKARVSARETASITEDLLTDSKFFSTNGSSPYFLHMDPNKVTALRGGAVQIAGFTDDFDGDIRFGNVGYAGNGSAPDIGADEFAGLQYLPFSGIVYVGTGQNFTSLTNSNGLFSKMNNLGFSGNVVVNITSNLVETGAEALNQWTEIGGTNYKLTIQPDVAAERLISGNALAGLIRLNGADRVKIDGGEGRNLIFRNTNTTGTTGTAFSLINGATYDTIRNCKIEAYANATNGVILIGTSGVVASGNSNILIEYNNINGTVNGNSSLTGIYSAGTTGKENVANTISNNLVYNYRDRGLDISASGSSNWNINNNHFYNGTISTAFTYDAAVGLHGMRISGGAGYSIQNNYIGGSDSLAGGTNAIYSSATGNVFFKGITLTTSAALPASVIKGNKIAKVTVSSLPQTAGSISFIGIETNGAGITVGGNLAGDGNTIGSSIENSSIVVNTSTTSLASTTMVSGISFQSTGGNVIGNQIGGIDVSNGGSSPAPSFVRGIYINTTTTPTQVAGNLIGSNSAVANSIQILPGSSAAGNTIAGIEVSSAATSSITLDRNVIQNISNRSTTASGSFTGIYNLATVAGATVTISNNRVANIYAAFNSDANTSVFTGISSTSPSVISNDTISNINHASNGSAIQLRGIYASGAFVHTINSNLISGLVTASSKSTDVETGTPLNYAIVGILNAASITGQALFANTITSLQVTNTDNIAITVTGIGIITTGNSGSIYRNRISALTNRSEGVSTMSGITGITGYNGSYTVYNNAIKLDNEINTNGIKIYGINHATNNAWNYFYNSIKISGNVTGTATRTACFVRTTAGSVTIKNNIFVNERVGTGNHFAISNKVASPASNWSAVNYNNLFAAIVSNVGEWGNGTNVSFEQWKLNSAGDNNSVSRSMTFAASTHDLVPANNTNCAIFQTGIAITSPIIITTDLTGVNRHATTPVMGAYEFSYQAFVVSASSNAPICSGGNLSLFANAGTALNPTYSWINADSLIVASTQNPIITASAGLFTVIVTDANGCATSASTMITLLAPLNATISYTGSPFCPGSTSVAANLSGTTGGVFSATSGLAINASTGVINLSGSTGGSYVITYTIPPANGCSQFQTTTSIAVLASISWTGASSVEWSSGSNWSCAKVPDANSVVIVPAGVPNFPVIGTGTASVKNLTIQSGATVTINGSLLQISGTITNNGNFKATDGRIEMNGAMIQTIPAGAFENNIIKSLTINNSSGVTMAGALQISDVLSISNGSLTTGDSLTLKSTATGTARVAQITSNATNPIIGKVTVERYIPGKRKYRLITSSVTTSNAASLAAGQEQLSIWGNWQNQGNNNTGNNGTIITGGDAASGFDQQTSTASLFTYNDSLRRFAGFTTANGRNTKYTPLKAGVAYYMFIYGDRLNSVTTTNPNATVLKSTGTLLTGNQVYTTTSPIPVSAVTGRFALLGNPYASPIDWATISKSDIASTYWGWDPNLNGTGGYVTVNTLGGVTLVAPFSGAVGLNQYIQPGQGFFVQTSGASPQLIIREQDKINSNNTNAFRTTNQVSIMAVNLLTSVSATDVLVDGTLAAFGENFTKEVNREDAAKMNGSTENIGILNGGTLLSIDARNEPLNGDTLLLNVYRLTKAKYTLQVFTKNMHPSNMMAYLEDSYLQTSQLLSLTDTNYIPFNVLTSIAASYDVNRFKIVFKQNLALPINYINVAVTSRDKHNVITWSVAQDQSDTYDVERSANGINFYPVGKVMGTKTDRAISYHFIDENPQAGFNYYRIRSTSIGASSISKIVSIKNEDYVNSISVYPNPVANQRIHLYLQGCAEGTYTVSLYDARGAQVLLQTIAHTGVTKKYEIQIKKKVPTNNYVLVVMGNNVKYSQNVMIE